MEKGISYLNRTFDDYKDALIEYSERYYPDLAQSYDDASVISWLIDLNADIADNLSYHIDRVYQETNLDSAQELASLYSIARNNGVKIPGPKGSMAEIKLSIVLPVGTEEDANVPNYSLAPIIKRGTQFSSSSQIFELLTDVDFAEQFDEDGNSNRTILQNLNTNGIITGYTISKTAVVTAGESRVYKYTVNSSDVKPFMEVLIPVQNVMNVESIIMSDDEGNVVAPSYGTFYSTGCSGSVRFYEVDNLAQSHAWLDSYNDSGEARTYTYGTRVDAEDGNTYVVPTSMVTKGEWRPIDHKFITEYTDKGYLKIIFGAGLDEADVELSSSGMTDFAKWQISRILNNKNLGVLPKANTTLYILYRIGGGKASNVAKGAINRVSLLNAELRGTTVSAQTVMQTLTVTNTTPSVSGKDMPTEKELKYYIKYNNAAQQRCVTIKDYIDRILQLPPRYGTPFRVGVMEENNKIMIYLLGIDYKGKLDTLLPITLIKNIENYLSNFRCINDFVEIKSGRIINLSFDIDVIIDKNYSRSDVVSSIISTVQNYMDINKHLMGEEIYIGDLEKEISKVDGVINLIGLDVFNNHGTINGQSYSDTEIGQETQTYDDDEDEKAYIDTEFMSLVDLEATDGILYNEGDTMMEVKYPEVDIRVRVKER